MVTLGSHPLFSCDVTGRVGQYLGFIGGAVVINGASILSLGFIDRFRVPRCPDTQRRAVRNDVNGKFGQCFVDIFIY